MSSGSGEYDREFTRLNVRALNLLVKAENPHANTSDKENTLVAWNENGTFFGFISTTMSLFESFLAYVTWN